MIDAVAFDLDGLLVQSEEVWDEARQALVRETGGRWHDDATREMMGMSSVEWSRYVHDRLGVALRPEEINARVLAEVERRYRADLPWIPGAREAVRRIAARWPLALATSSNREIIDLVLEVGELSPCFRATVSSEEVAKGKPAPDAYLEAARRLGVAPERCAAVEDSTNGLKSARAAGMRVIAVPNDAFPPAPEGLEAADVVLASIDELTPETIASLPPAPSRSG
ncbi:MAG TPA: HAD family phosphatase [Solirubrobacteraceae bacterium]|nr:HAD family phosphatase [Solirubrobacteraceae bacterium]